MKLVVGLGNPGKQYQNSRHNIGFRVVDELLAAYPDKTKVNVPSLIGDLEKPESTFLVLKPTSFMNNSGVEVSKVTSFFKIPPTDVLVVHDDVDLPLGEVKLETGRGSAGHRGVESIINSFGTKDFFKLRVGVGRPPENIPTDAYVLENFSTEEEGKLTEIISNSIQNIQDWLK